MTRYFYINEYTAAYMRDAFGMRFTDQAGTELEWCSEFSCFYLPSGDEQAWDQKFYLHPDSLPKLEPQNYDVVEADDDWCGRQMYYVDDGLHKGYLTPRTREDLKRAYSVRIIEREGKSFHPLEQEP